MVFSFYWWRGRLCVGLWCVRAVVGGEKCPRIRVRLGVGESVGLVGCGLLNSLDCAVV